MVASNGQAWSGDVDKWVEDRIEALEELGRQSILRVCYEVLLATPVWTGFLRGSWQPSIGEPDTATQGQADTSTDPYRVNLTVNQLKLGEVFWLSNNAAYGMRVNYGFVGEDSLGRHYNQPGRFFLEDTLARWDAFVAEEGAKLGLVAA